jgi:RHS repeat-associated protein
MKTFIAKLTTSLALFLFLSAAQIASAFYDPSLGRWLNRDPIGEKGGHNPSPLTRMDPPVLTRSDPPG